MKPVYDPNFKRPDPDAEPGSADKAKVTIRIDADILEYFEVAAERTGHKVKWQTLMNNALREWIKSKTSR